MFQQEPTPRTPWPSSMYTCPMGSHSPLTCRRVAARRVSRKRVCEVLQSHQAHASAVGGAAEYARVCGLCGAHESQP
eukprot:4638034-Prymnesium_polylepis.1